MLELFLLMASSGYPTAPNPLTQEIENLIISASIDKAIEFFNEHWKELESHDRKYLLNILMSNDHQQAIGLIESHWKELDEDSRCSLIKALIVNHHAGEAKVLIQNHWADLISLPYQNTLINHSVINSFVENNEIDVLMQLINEQWQDSNLETRLAFIEVLSVKHKDKAKQIWNAHWEDLKSHMSSLTIYFIKNGHASDAMEVINGHWQTLGAREKFDFVQYISFLGTYPIEVVRFMDDHWADLMDGPKIDFTMNLLFSNQDFAEEMDPRNLLQVLKRNITELASSIKKDMLERSCLNYNKKHHTYLRLETKNSEDQSVWEIHGGSSGSPDYRP